ncbi:MAG: T9SS type A sorting domain-containing protein [Cytophagaceae bacterium]|nr:T9SS type A sorting domain-containing protein [Cytophagaceae bacterium]MDW8457424.1 T9SS type A sorting domain-containing protein [Cytophagaceae bacterium]
MKNVVHYLSVLFLITFCISKAHSQIIPVSIATWKNNALGAYNIIHDDFCDYGVIGIQNYADTMHVNRGLKFTFGAITSSCENNPGMYAAANTLISHGHEIINHSHNHTCAVWQSWCTTGLWAQPGSYDFVTQMSYSSQSILNNTGRYPRYFIYPYDQYNDTANRYLKSIGYIGSRTGANDAAENSNFAPDAQGFFRTALVVDVQNVSGSTVAVNLNQWVDYAINNNAWVNRELHNVGNTGWGRVSVTDYRNHLNYVKSKRDAGQLWVGTISEILTYQIQKLNYTPSSSRNPTTGVITVSWNTPSFNVANYLAPLHYKSPITLNVNVSAHPGTYTVWQNGVQITDFTVVSNVYRINIYPHNGPVTLVPGVLSLSQDQNYNNTFLNDILASSINIYPNPAKENVTITLPNVNSDYSTLQVLNLQGNILIEKEATTGDVMLDISVLPKGIYILRIPSSNLIVTKKLVKE